MEKHVSHNRIKSKYLLELLVLVIVIIYVSVRNKSNPTKTTKRIPEILNIYQPETLLNMCIYSILFIV